MSGTSKSVFLKHAHIDIQLKPIHSYFFAQVLKKVANAGASVLFTIHQPSSEIFNSFDHLILLNKGRVMYQGSVNEVPDYFRERGHPNPPNYNPADWIMNVAQSVSMKELDEHGFFPKDERDIAEPFEPEDGKDALGITVTGRSIRGDSAQWDDTPPGIGTQIKLLFRREINNLYRDTTAVAARFGLTIFLSTLIGVIFLNVGKTSSLNSVNRQSHFGALIMVLLSSMFGKWDKGLQAGLRNANEPLINPLFNSRYCTASFDRFSLGTSCFSS